MPLTSGKLAPEHDQKIKKNYRFIKDNIDAKDLTDYFIEGGLFDFPDVDEINGFNPNTVENRNNCFLKLLFKSGPRAYEVFLDALERNGQQFVADKIVNTPVEIGQVIGAEGDDHGSWLRDIPQHVRTRRLVERDMSRLAQTFKTGWEMVMPHFGLSQPEVDHAKLENPTSVAMQVYTCLNKWKMKVASGATLEGFVNVVAAFDSSIVEWSQVEQIAKNMV